ncbi:MAG: alpha/beta fold hydrolase [bacterium]
MGISATVASFRSAGQRLGQALLSQSGKEYRPLPGPEGSLVDFSPNKNLCAMDYTVELKDGYKLWMKRIYKGNPEYPPKDGRKVAVLIHGYAENGNIFRLDQDGEILNLEEVVSAANRLADEGYDVFIPHFWGKRFQKRYVENFYGPDIPQLPTANVSFDHIVQWDMPRVMDRIQEIVEDDNLNANLIGHSCGGDFVYAYQGFSQDPRVKKILTQGAPVGLDSKTPLTPRILAANWVTTSLGLLERTPFDLASEYMDLITYFMSRTPRPLMKYLPGSGIIFSDDVSNDVLHGFFRRVTETISPNITMFFAQMQMTGRFASLREASPEELIAWLNDFHHVPIIAYAIELLRLAHMVKPISYQPGADLEELNYGELMGAIEVPAHIVAGSADKLIPPDCVFPAVDLLGTRPELIFTEELLGTSHLGLVVSHRVDPWARVIEFLGRDFSR